MYEWTEQKIRWYESAVAYTGFDKKLADILEDYLPVGQSVCDLGCGIGYLALELARRGHDTTAIDCSAVALNWLRGKCDREQNLSLRILERDWSGLGTEPQWDHIITVCAGRNLSELTRFRQLCRKRLIVVDRAQPDSHVRTDGGHSSYCLELPDLEHKAEVIRRFSLEFGQPLRSLEDVRQYVSVFGGEATMEETLSRLEPTGNPACPLYLPYQKELSLFVIPSLWLGR